MKTDWTSTVSSGNNFADYCHTSVITGLELSEIYVSLWCEKGVVDLGVFNGLGTKVEYHRSQS